jgi:hypothetical protein
LGFFLLEGTGLEGDGEDEKIVTIPPDRVDHVE